MGMLDWMAIGMSASANAQSSDLEERVASLESKVDKILEYIKQQDIDNRR